MIFMSEAFDGLLERLRAAGEPTRLRLLALLHYQDLSVGELVQVLEQSQPRLPHHLKALSEAGLAERLPEGAFVFYRAARSGPGKELLDALFSALGPDLPEIDADLERLHTVMAGRHYSRVKPQGPLHVACQQGTAATAPARNMMIVAGLITRH